MVLRSILPALAHHSLNPEDEDEGEDEGWDEDEVAEGATVLPVLPPSSGSPYPWPYLNPYSNP
jgi:hypothetical protein